MALLAGTAAIGALAAVKVKYALLAAVVAALAGWIAARPPVAAYLLIFLTPLIVGVNAGAVVPLVRPNEAIMLLAAAVLGVRWLIGLRSGDRHWPRVDRVDVTLLALGITSSVLPLMMMLGRDRTIAGDDILYSIVIWKLFAEYAIVRTTITTREQAMRCLMLSMISAGIVCLVGILQSLGLFGVPGLLAKYYSPLNVTSSLSIGRGSSLLSLPAAVADLAILNICIALAMIARGYRRRLLLVGLAATFALGVVAAAEFSTVIGLLIALIAVAVLTRSARIVGYAIPVGLAGGALLWPVIQIRLSGFHSASGLPVSWLTRLQNLRTYFWPPCSPTTTGSWACGRRPASSRRTRNTATSGSKAAIRGYCGAAGFRCSPAMSLSPGRPSARPALMRAAPTSRGSSASRWRAVVCPGDADGVRPASDLPRLR